MKRVRAYALHVAYANRGGALQPVRAYARDGRRSIVLAEESLKTSIESDSVILNAEKTQHGIERIAVAG